MLDIDKIRIITLQKRIRYKVQTNLRFEKLMYIKMFTCYLCNVCFVCGVRMNEKMCVLGMDTCKYKDQTYPHDHG